MDRDLGRRIMGRHQTSLVGFSNVKTEHPADIEVSARAVLETVLAEDQGPRADRRPDKGQPAREHPEC